AGRWDDLLTLHRALCARAGQRQADALRHDVEQVTAMHTPDGACSAAFQMLRAARRSRAATRLADILACAQPWDALRARLAPPSSGSLHPEDIADLITCALLRGQAPDHDDVVEAAWKGVARADPALAWAPPRR